MQKIGFEHPNLAKLLVFFADSHSFTREASKFNLSNAKLFLPDGLRFSLKEFKFKFMLTLVWSLRFGA